MTTRNRRPAFTMMEMMIVMGIILVIAAIMIPASLALTDRSFVPKAASMLENALAYAKTLAVAEKRPHGIRLIASNRSTTVNGISLAWYDEIQFIENPGDYVEAWVWGLASNNFTVLQPFWSLANTPGPAAPLAGALPLGFDGISVFGGPFTYMATDGTTIAQVTRPRNRLLFGPISWVPSTAGGNTWTGNSNTNYKSQRLEFNYVSTSPIAVQRGDKVELFGTGEVFTVQSVSWSEVGAATVTNINIGVPNSKQPIPVPIIEVDRDLPQDINVPLNGRPNYRIIRQPRPIPSIQPVKLPQEVVIDATPVFLVGVNKVATDVSGSIYMSGVGNGNAGGQATWNGTGVRTSEITGLTTVTPPPPPYQVAPPYIDIVFSPSGEVIPTGQSFASPGPPATVSSFNVSQDDLIVLWLHAYGDPNLWAARQPTAAQGNADNQALVAVHARTGMIGSYPVAVPTTYNDPLAFVRNGIGRKSSETGP
jgi:prepilin-type N-terminal cleavage/methylation domain-containing protein